MMRSFYGEEAGKTRMCVDAAPSSMGPMLWNLAVEGPAAELRSSEYDTPAAAWRAYERNVRELEDAGFARNGPEDIRYGVGSTQRLVRDGAVVSVHIERGDI
jgi:hypothetical protein